QVNQHPREIEQRGRAEARQKVSHLIEILYRPQPATGVVSSQRQTRYEVVNAPGQRLVNRAANADKKTAAQQVEDTLAGIEDCRDDDESHECGEAAARQHTVIDLEHEKRASQRQD